ncbi:MAG: sensor histidine kinase [Candidatus Taylorbacteria bacterium]|nr:sensor histidine kinase [Candidatus Taylorbacteria bacterium]
MFELGIFEGKLKIKILRMMFFIGFVPIVILGLLSFYSLKIFHQFDIASIEGNLLNQKSEEIQGFVDNIISAFQLQVGFEQTTDIELPNQHFLLERMLNAYPELTEVSFININGRETSKFRRSSSENILVEDLIDQGNTDKFKTARAGENYISPAYFTSSGPMVTIAAPVLNKNNYIISILSGEIKLNDFQEIIQRSHIGNSGYVYVVDNNGLLIAHSQESKLTLVSLKNLAFIASVLSKSDQDELAENNRYTSFWGEKVVSAGKYIDALQMAVIVEWPVSDADKVVNTLTLQALVVSVLVLAGTIFFSILLSSRIVNPVKSLERGAHLIAEGKFDQPINIKTGDEIEELGIAFNDMMAGLKKLKELEKEFVFIAAHDLRTPVSAMKGYLSMVLAGDYGQVTPSVKDVLVKVTNANQRLVQLVNDLLQVARAEAGRIPVKVASIDIRQPINEILIELKPLADQKNIVIVYESPEQPAVLADAERLKEAMVNLVGNAIKYTLGSGTVTISHEVKDNSLVTHIKDTGMGMSIEAQKNLFEKYYRVENEKTNNIQGTGLGLFIVKQLLEKMNGFVWAVSEEGKGSTFSFSLPLAG